MRHHYTERKELVFFSVLLLFCVPAGAYTDEAVHSFNQGNALMQEKDYANAGLAYDRAISLEPGYFEAWNGKADALNRAGSYRDALTASSRALEINSGFVPAWINHGQILYNIGYYYEDTEKDPIKAEEYYRDQLHAFEQAVRLDPTNAEAHFNKGYALAGLKRYDEALAAFDTVEALDFAYPNLALSQKQARVLRDAATPGDSRSIIPLAGLILIILIASVIIWRMRSGTGKKEEPVTENRRARRRKEE
jgi:tetratricopeptide (TPR) repeat protein